MVSLANATARIGALFSSSRSSRSLSSLAESSLVTVLRVELLDERRLGPYSCTLNQDFWDLGDYLDGIHKESPTHPAWFQDRWQRFDKISEDSAEKPTVKLQRPLSSFLGIADPIAGFLDQQQLENWFEPDVRTLLDEFGYCLASYRVAPERLFVSPFQAIFDRATATLLQVDEL